MSTSTAHRPPATRHHLHEVLAALDAHVDDTASVWRRLMYLNGSVTIETEPGDLTTLCAAFGLGEPRPEPVVASAGGTHVVVPWSATGSIDGAPLRIWARSLLLLEDYRALVAALPCANAASA